MLDIRWIRDNPQALDAALARRGAEPQAEQLIALDEDRRAHIRSVQALQERRNAASKAIGQAMAAKDTDAADKLKAEVAALKDELQAGEAKEREAEAALHDALAGIPNILLDDVPEGADESDSAEVRRVGRRPEFDFEPKEHWELGEALGLMDFEAAASMSGARFTVLKGELARLERALAQFMLDLHTTEHGYQEISPPLLVRDAALFGTGQLPKFKDDLFPAMKQFPQRELLIEGAVSSILNEISRMRGSEASEEFQQRIRAVVTDNVDLHYPDIDLWLIPTAEVPLTNLVREQIVDAETLPRRYTALTPCFRSEAGSAGKDTRGMLRQHQFMKVELVSITDADSSLEELDRMTHCAEEVLKRLELPFRTVVLASGDTGFGARKTHDIEVWLPGQNAYREISSCSVCGDFQARRMNARYRRAGDKDIHFVHTLNGSGVAVGRALIALMENYQNADGSITVPQALRPWFGGTERIGPA